MMYAAPSLHQAVNRRNLPEVRRLISGSGSPRGSPRHSALAAVNEYWREETPLHIACKHGYGDIAALLLSSGGDVDGRTGTSPLHAAAANGHLVLVNLLLCNGADINRRAVNGSTPLWRAANAGHADVCRRLAEVGANVNQSARCDDRRLTPLQTASNEGHLDVVQLLIMADCELDVRDSFGRTALHYACDMGYSGVVQCLLTVGADPHIKDQQGYFPLHAATSMSNTETVRVLAEHGHHLSAGAGTFAGTALHLAVTLQLPESTQALIDAGTDLDERDSSKYTPLYLAAHTEPMGDVSVWYDTIMRLIRGGSDVNSTMPVTNSLLEVTITKRLWPFTMLLLDADCRIRRDALLRYLARCPPDVGDAMEARFHEVRSLRVACRMVLREFIRRYKLWPLEGTVEMLPLPGAIKRFVNMADIAVVT